MSALDYGSRLLEIWRALDEEQRIDRIPEFFTEEYVHHSSENSYTRAEFAAALGELFEAFPSLTFTLHEAIVEGHRVAYRWSTTGMHSGPYLGIPATGRSATVSGISMCHFEGQRISVGWSAWSEFSALQDLGIVTVR